MHDLNQSTADVVVPKRRCSNANLTGIARGRKNVELHKQSRASMECFCYIGMPIRGVYLMQSLTILFTLHVC